MPHPLEHRQREDGDNDLAVASEASTICTWNGKVAGYALAKERVGTTPRNGEFSHLACSHEQKIQL
jgi:hypothetical protein